MRYIMTEWEENGVKDFEKTFSNIREGEKFLVKESSSSVSSIYEIEFLRSTERCVKIKWHRLDGSSYVTWEFKHIFSNTYYLVESLWEG